MELGEEAVWNNTKGLSLLSPHQFFASARFDDY
jgi:hypothetical protein